MAGKYTDLGPITLLLPNNLPSKHFSAREHSIVSVQLLYGVLCICCCQDNLGVPICAGFRMSCTHCLLY